ncbi:MAG: hypothetical protein OJF50_006477 [Nitrospira sp.]|nr:hypothetical protein [Nitrospira sp.]
MARNLYPLVRRRELDCDAAEMLYRRLHGDPVAPASPVLLPRSRFRLVPIL